MALAVVLAFCATPLLASTGDEQQTIEALRILIAHDPTNPELPQLHEALGHFLLGIKVEVDEETAKEAEYHLHRAVELDPSLYWGWYDLAILHMDTEEGNQYLKNAIAANPQFPEPYYWLAYTYSRNYRDAEAILIFEQYLQVIHSYPDAAGRMELAEKLLAELRTGGKGKELRKVRRPEGPEAHSLSNSFSDNQDN